MNAESWSCPLDGRVVALTRPRDRLAPLADAFARAGASVVLCPVLRLVPVEGRARDESRGALHDFVEGGTGWLAITSPSVVPVLESWLAGDPNLRLRVEEDLRIATVGPASSEAVKGCGLPVSLEGSGAGAGALADRLLAEDPSPRALHLTSDRGLPTLGDRIEAAGGTARRVVAVEHRPEPELDPEVLLRAPPAELIVFASPSAAEGLLAAARGDRREVLVARPALAIGSTTAGALADLGFTDVTVAGAPTPDAIVAAAVSRLVG